MTPGLGPVGGGAIGAPLLLSTVLENAPKQPNVWVTYTHRGTEYRIATRPFADSSSYQGGWKEGRVDSYEPIVRCLSDPSGQFEVNRFGWIERDTDRRIRGELGDLDGEFLVNDEASISLVSEYGRKSESIEPRILTRGRIRDPQSVEGLKFRWVGEDIIGADFGIYSGSKKIPQRVITRELFPGVHRDLVGQGLPIIYGEVSDEGARDAAGELSEKGLVPAFWVGDEEIGGDGWGKFLIAGHACKEIHSVFGSNLGSPAKRVKLDDAVYGVTVLAPGKAGWPFADPYRDFPDGDGITNRTTTIYVKGEVYEAHVSGGINITVNLCGIEDVGDGSGDLIRHYFRVYQHALHNWVLANNGKGYYSGTWAPLTEWSIGGPTVTVLNTDSFDAAQDFTATRLGDGIGYLADFALCERIDLREFVKRFNLSGDCFTGVNRHAQLIVKHIDDGADVSSTTLLRQWDFASPALPAPDIKHSDVENPVRSLYDWDADKKKFRSDMQSVADAAVQTAQREVNESDVLQLFMVRDSNTADDVAARRLLRLKRAPRYQDVVLDLSGLQIDLGDIYRVTHYDGLGPNGYVEEPFFCVRHKVDLYKMQVTLTGFNIGRILSDEAAGMNFKRVVTTITDTQLKGTMPVVAQILAAPGAGYTNIPHAIVLQANFAAGAYGGVDNDAFIVAQYAGGFEWSNYIANIDSAGLTYADVFLDGTEKRVVLREFQDTNDFSLAYGALADARTNRSYENLALQLKFDNNGAGDLSGGHADNTLKVTVYYTTEAVP